MGFDEKKRGRHGCHKKEELSVRGCVPNRRSLEAVLGAGFYLE